MQNGMLQGCDACLVFSLVPMESHVLWPFIWKGAASYFSGAFSQDGYVALIQ